MGRTLKAAAPWLIYCCVVAGIVYLVLSLRPWAQIAGAQHEAERDAAPTVCLRTLRQFRA